MTDISQKVSAVILAGGLSSRMGRSKAELEWDGVTLLEHQVKKLQMLGISDVLVSGYPKPPDGTGSVADRYPKKGPLSGIHAGLSAAVNEHCLIVSVDTPLMPVNVLEELVTTHLAGASGITILSHEDKLEPLMGVYDKKLAGMAEEILGTDNTSVRVLLRRAGYSEYAYTGDALLLCDCNTPEEYASAKRINERGLQAVVR